MIEYQLKFKFKRISKSPKKRRRKKRRRRKRRRSLRKRRSKFLKCIKHFDKNSK